VAWTCVLVTGLIIGIELFARSGLVSPLDLVPVTDMFRHAVELAADRRFVVDDLLRTFLSVMASFLLAALLGVTVAWLMVEIGWARAALQPYLNVFYAVPFFALYPILVVLFGTGMAPIIILGTGFSIVVIISNATAGFDSVSPSVRKLSKSLRLTRRHHFRLILLPTALPDILAGFKLGLAYSVIAVLASEFIVSTHGLGRTVADAYNSFNTPRMYGAILFVIVFALLANVVLGSAFRRWDWRRR
jgi:NitT/TauT family transport system permease protein